MKVPMKNYLYSHLYTQYGVRDALPIRVGTDRVCSAFPNPSVLRASSPKTRIGDNMIKKRSEIRHCVVCNNKFKFYYSSGYSGLFCGINCRRLILRETRILFKCEYCGENMEAFPSYGIHRFCSRKCTDSWKIGKTFDDLYGSRAKEIKNKMSESGLGRIMKKSQKLLLSKIKKGQIPSKKCIEAAIKVNTGNTYRLGKKHTLESRKKMSKKLKGRRHTKEEIRKLSESNIGKHNIPHKKETIIKMRKIALQNWSNPDYAKKMFRAFRRRPTIPELNILNIFLKFDSNWKYVGDGKFWINGKNPDIMNCNGQKKVVEMFGDYWHNIQDEIKRKKHFKKYGFNCLVIWQEELKRNIYKLEQKIIKFVTR